MKAEKAVTEVMPMMILLSCERRRKMMPKGECLIGRRRFIQSTSRQQLSVVRP